MSQPNLHTLSQQPVQDFDPSDPSFFDVTGNQLPQIIRGGNVAAIAVVSQSGRIVLLYSPMVTTDEYNNDFAIQGNLVDDKSVRRFAQVELSSLGFIVSFTTKRPTHFSMGTEITGLNGTSNFGRRTITRFTPNFVLVPYQQPKFPSGQIENEDILSTVEEWSPPAATILDSILSVRQNYDPTIALHNEILSNNREDELIRSDFTEQRFPVLHAFVCVDQLDEGADDIDSTLLQRFVPPSLQQPVIQQAPVPAPPAPVLQPAPVVQPSLPAQPGQPVPIVQPPPQQGTTAPIPSSQSNTNTNNQQIIVLNATDVDKDLPINVARIRLFFVCGDLDNVQPSTLLLPDLSSGFELVLRQTTTSGRFKMFDSLLENTCDTYRDTKNVMADMVVRDDPFLKAFLGGCFAGDPYVLNPSSSPASTELNLLSFGPQTNDRAKVDQIEEKKKKVQAEIRSGVPDAQRSTMDSLIPTFGNILDVDDTLKTIDNFKMIASAVIAMSGSKVPMIVKLYNEFDDFITSRSVQDWLKQYGPSMTWIHATLMVRLQSVYVALAKFSRSFLPLSAITANPTDAVLQGAVGSKDTQFIKGAVSSLRQLMAAVNTAIASHAALSAETFCPQSERNRHQIDVSGHKRPVSASAATGREQVLVNNQGQVDAFQQSFRGNAQRSNQHQRNQQRNVRNQAPRNKSPTQLGIFHLQNANLPNEQIFPHDALVFVRGQQRKVCPDFTCFGKECPHGRDCQLAHPTNYAKFDQQVFDSICQHFLSNNVGWMSSGMLEKQSKIVLAPRFGSLRGDANGRFNTHG